MTNNSTPGHESRNKHRVIIHVEGGTVSRVYGDAGVEYMIVDHDIMEDHNAAPPPLDDYCGPDGPIVNGEALLTALIDDWEPARDDGLCVHHDVNGWYLCTDDEAKHEELTGTSSGFDMRLHYSTKHDAFFAKTAT